MISIIEYLTLKQEGWLRNQDVSTRAPAYSGGIYEIFFPFSNNIEKAVLTLADGAVTNPIPRGSGRIVMYGGVNLLGIGCTSANFICSNILERVLKMEVVNLSVWNRSFLDNKMGECINAYKPKMIILECSCKGMSVKYLEKTVQLFIRYNQYK